jgi:hypothetical protein
MAITAHTRIFLTQFAADLELNLALDCMLHIDEIVWHMREGLLNH